MAIKFPTDTADLIVVADTDKLLLADASDSDVSKDIELSILVDYMIDKLQTANVGVPIPTAESQMLVSDGTNNWVLATHFNAGDYAARAFVFQIIHNSTGGPGAPTLVSTNIGELAINFDTAAGSQPEIWASNGTDWVRANPDLDVEMAYIILAGGTAGDKTGIGAAWDAYTPKPTEPFIIATYGGVPYLNTGNALLDVGWDYLVDPTVAQTATTDAQAAAAAAAVSETNAGNSATASEISAAESEGFYNNRSGLEKITEGGNTGLAVVGQDRTHKGVIGQDSIDLSILPPGSMVGGGGATGDFSKASGVETHSAGENSSTEGKGTKAPAPCSHACGRHNLGDSLERVFEIGVGVSAGSKANAFEAYFDGTLTAPKATISEIDARGESAVPTLEYLHQATDTSPPEPVEGYSYFDTQRGKPLWYFDGAWVDATGTEV